MTEPFNLDIRYTYITDMGFLRRWLNSTEMLSLFLMKSEKEVDEAIRVWGSFCRWSCSLTATIDHVPCGLGTLFLMPYKKIAHQAFFKVVVDPRQQKRGIGTALIRNLQHLAKNYFHLEALAIEILEGNRIVSLLLNNGFSEIFRQEKFVKDNGEYRARICFEREL
jgi:GNAT superfamily N-acetyltransferase